MIRVLKKMESDPVPNFINLDPQHCFRDPLGGEGKSWFIRFTIGESRELRQGFDNR